MYVFNTPTNIQFIRLLSLANLAIDEQTERFLIDSLFICKKTTSYVIFCCIVTQPFYLFCALALSCDCFNRKVGNPF